MLTTEVETKELGSEYFDDDRFDLVINGEDISAIEELLQLEDMRLTAALVEIS